MREIGAVGLTARRTAIDSGCKVTRSESLLPIVHQDSR